MKKTTWLMVFTVFLGTQILAINIGFKLSIYRIAILLITGLFGMLVINGDPRIKFYPQKFSHMYTLFFGIWFLYSVFSVIWATNYGGWLKANVFLGIGFLSIVYIVTFCKEKNDVINLIKSIVMGAVIHILIGYTELYSGKYLWASEHFMSKYRPENRNFLTRIPISIYPNENDYATVLLMGFFFLMILFRNSRTLIMRLSYLFMMGSAVFLIIQTDSRANVLALIIGLATMVVVYFSKIITRKIFATIGVITFSFPTLVILFNHSIQGKIINTLVEIFTNTDYTGTSNETRINLIKNGFYFVRETFGFGVGAGNIEHYMLTVAPYPTGGISNMHNWWMEILTGYGIGIFIIYLVVYISMVFQAWRYYRTSKDTFVTKTSIIIIGYLSAFIFSSLSSATNLINEWIWIVFGVIIAFYAYCEQEKKQEVPSSKQNRHMRVETQGGRNE